MVDVPSEQALAEIRQFAKEESSSRHLLLAIMSHGRKESIVFSGDEDVPIQKIIHALDVNPSQQKVSAASQ